MKMPTDIRIGGIDYEIKCKSDLNDGIRFLHGCISYEESTIEINTNTQGYQQQCVTLWHEILHGIVYHSGLKIEDEELTIDTLAKGIYQVLQDNGGKLFDLQDGDDD